MARRFISSRGPLLLWIRAVLEVLDEGARVTDDRQTDQGQPCYAQPCSSVMGQSLGRSKQFCLFCAAVHFLEGADLSDRFGSANLPGGVPGNRLGRGHTMSDRWVTLPV